MKEVFESKCGISRTLNSLLLLRICAAVASILFYLAIFGSKILNPTYTDWLLRGGDLSQHYLGWLAYRNSSWHFPIGMIDNLAYPNLVSIIFTDSIPLFAVFFKSLSSFLPKSFQYFGFWGVLCFVLQAQLTISILKKYTDNYPAIFFAALLVIITPTMVNRMYWHTALAGQWVLLYGFYILLNINQHSKKTILINIGILALISSFIHIYFVLMNGIIICQRKNAVFLHSIMHIYFVVHSRTV